MQDSLKDRLFIFIQRILPQHFITRLAGMLAQSEIGFVKNAFIKNFIKVYGVNMAEALYPSEHDYLNFNDFFTRPLKSDARPIDVGADSIVSPADGEVSQLGPIQSGNLIQAKGKNFTVEALLGGDSEMAQLFENGSFVTVYLSPRDYHRVHMPVAGRLQKMIYVPGKLFSVNTVTAERVDDLFAINERVVTLFESEKGPMAVILVGAMIVGSIETQWQGTVVPSAAGMPFVTSYHDKPIDFAKGVEMGRFKLGSTAIVLLPEATVRWEDRLYPGAAVQMGQRLGCFDREG